MKETYRKVTATDGTTYILHQSEDTKITSELPWIGVELYNLMKEQQPERLKEMRDKKELIPFLTKIAREYNRKVDWLIQAEGIPIDQAKEREWPDLIAEAGLK